MAKEIQSKALSDLRLEEIIMTSSLPILLTFVAPWSGSSTMQSNVVNALTKERKGSIKSLILDVEENQHQQEIWGIYQIPTTLILFEGEVITFFPGMVSKKQLIEVLDTLTTGEN